MKEFCALRAKTYSYLMNDASEVKKSKGTKKCLIKQGLMFENYTDCLINDKIILKSQQRFESDHHKIYTEEVNKIALISNVDGEKQINTIQDQGQVITIQKYDYDAEDTPYTSKQKEIFNEIVDESLKK